MAILPVGHMGGIEVENNIALTVTVCNASTSKWEICIIHVPWRLAGMDLCMDNSCKRRAEYLHCSLVIICTECGQWQASFIRGKSACLAEVSVYGNFQIPRNPGKTEHVQMVITRLFSPHPRTSLGTRLVSVCVCDVCGGWACLSQYTTYAASVILV